MATVPAGTIFSAIKAGTNVDKRSALINRNTLEYTIEDIASSVGGQVDLSQYLKIVDASSTYQTLSGMSNSVNTIVYGGNRTDAYFYATQDVFANNAAFLPSQTRNQKYGAIYFDSQGYTLAATSVMYITLVNNTIASNSTVLFTVENPQPLNIKFTVTAAVNAGQVTFAIYMDKTLDSNRGLGIRYAVM